MGSARTRTSVRMSSPHSAYSPRLLRGPGCSRTPSSDSIRMPQPVRRRLPRDAPAGIRRDPVVGTGARWGRLLWTERAYPQLGGQVGLHELESELGNLRVQSVEWEAERVGEIPVVHCELR